MRPRNAGSGEGAPGASSTATLSPNPGRNRQPIEPRDRQIALGCATSSRQPADLPGFFKPTVVMPVRGDWLVELRGIEPLTSAVRLQRWIDFQRLLRFSIHDQSP